MEVRLIDELTLQRELFCQIQQNAIESGSAHYDGYKNWCLSGLEVEKAISDIFSETGLFCPTIDPETLPIVRELREKLERVTAERNTALKSVKQLKAEKAAATGELNGVLASVYRLTKFVDDEVHPAVDYDLYWRLRDMVDEVICWEHADEWGAVGGHP